MSKYFQTSNEYLAKSLSYLGLRYYVYKNDDVIKYSFKQSKELSIALRELKQLKTIMNQQLRGGIDGQESKSKLHSNIKKNVV